MIYVIGNTKGGVGKTTLCLNFGVALAIAGRDVWLVNGDRQETLAQAVAHRAVAGHAPSLACSSYADGKQLRAQIAQQAPKYDDTIIDAGGRDSSALRAALVLADVLLVPFAPRSYDVWALDDIAALIDDAQVVNPNLRAYAVLNGADTSARSTDNAEAAEAVASIPQLTFIDAPIGRRKAFANAGGRGLSVLESKPNDRRACKELEALLAALV